MQIRILLFCLIILVSVSSTHAESKLDEGLEIDKIIFQRTLSSSFSSPAIDIEPMLRQKLSASDAVQIALLKNADLQATLKELGIASADLAEAGLIDNPVLEVALGFPIHSRDTRTAVDLSLTQNFVSLWQRPLRKRLAQAEFEGVKLHLAHKVMSKVAEVKVAYYYYQAALQEIRFRESILSGSQASTELSQAQRKAGNISELDFAQQKALAQSTKLELEKSKAEARIAREKLRNLLGISSSMTSWAIVEKLPPLPKKDTQLASLESLAKTQRLDIAASQKKMEAASRSIDLSRSAYLPSFNAGIRAELDAEGNNSVGPTISIGLPLTKQRKIAIDRAQAQLKKNEKEFEALALNIKSEIKRTYEQLLLARQTALYYQNNIIPLLNKINQESLKHYNYMLLSNYELIQAKQNQIAAQVNYIQALRDYWMAHAELESLVGGLLIPENTSNSEGK
jgi:cobalt-zinc-cadmium efflux system outer membrane protein